MAREFYAAYDAAAVLYGLVFRENDNYVYIVSSQTFEAIGTWNDARIQAAAIAMAVDGGFHLADWPDMAAGTYLAQIRIRDGAQPAITDTAILQKRMDWNGSKEVAGSDIVTAQQTVVSDTDESVKPEQIVTLKGL